MPTTESSTEQMTITLPRELANFVRAKVASGKYVSESAFISDLLLEDVIERSEDFGPSDEWIVKHALPALDELDANPSSGTLHEDFLVELAQERAQLAEKAS